ncbi:MAG TPA: LysR family transcriptional regulator [Kofleriaceae bacterium]|nr:LysR family transcriptional regulator [Kofleriaceae bacterium]
MEWLNYHHLLYFWMVAREGSLASAGKRLRLSQPTLSGQIRKLEEAFGERLFERKGRGLVLTDIGQVAYRYADEIFTTGNELLETMRRGAKGRPVRLTVGIVDAVPKLLVRRLLDPALRLPDPVRLICREGRLERLVEGIGRHEIDVVISDAPLPSGSTVRAWDHPLGQSDMTLLGTPAVVNPRRKGFPRTLDDAPLLLPLESSVLRRNLEAWFAGLEVQPRVVAEAEDTALLLAFAADGMGIMFAPSVVADIVARRYGLVVLGTSDGVRERYFAITGERRLVHPAVIAIREAARGSLLEPE